MRTHRTLAALGALVAAAGWFLLRGHGAHPASPAAAVPAPDALHEKIFLAEQLRRNPRHVPILLRLAEIERGEGDLAGARHRLEQALDGGSGEEEVRLELGLVCSEMGDAACAEEQNRAVLRAHPDQPDALYNLGALAANRDDFAQARKLWTAVVAQSRGTGAAAKAEQALARIGTVR